MWAILNAIDTISTFFVFVLRYTKLASGKISEMFKVRLAHGISAYPGVCLQSWGHYD